MNILIVQDNAINESIAIADLVGYLEEKGHHFDLLIEKEENRFIDKIIISECDIILIPADIGGHHWAHSIAKQIKCLTNKIIVIAGVYPTFYPDVVFKDNNFDYIIVGEAEITFSRFLRGIESGKDVSLIRGLWGKKNGLSFRNGMGDPVLCLDDMPMPKREIYYKYAFMKHFPLKKFATGRGCYNNCSFCYNPLLKKQYPASQPYVRRKSVKKVIYEINFVKDNSTLKSIHFSDDIFITSEEWLEEFAREFPVKVGIRFSCNASMDTLTEKRIKLLKKAGCRAVSIGIESGNLAIRRDVLNKDFSNKESINKARWLKQNDIMVFTFNMIGLPNESFENILETFSINYLMNTDHVRVFIATPLPGTQLFETFKKMGDISGIESIMDLPDFSQMKSRNKYLKLNKKHQKLAIIFPYLYKFPHLYKYINFFLWTPIYFIMKICFLIFLFKEKNFFEFDLISGARYFYHTGSPYKRTKNFVTLV